MAMTLITGLPGSGKSLEVVRMMRDDFKDRKKYAANFPGLAFDLLDIEEFNPMDWAKCDAGSVLFIDEAWEYFEARGPHKMPPDVIKEFARHRHYGLDIFLVCQGPFQLDSHVRALIENHLHVIRPFGMKYSIIRKFRGVNAFPGDKQSMKDTVDVATKRRFDKTLFPFYKSAEVHTVKRKIPFKMIGSFAVIIACGWAIWNMVAWGKDFYAKQEILTGQPGAPPVDAAASPVHESPGAAFGLGGTAGALPLLGTSEFAAAKFAHKSNHYFGEALAVDGAPWTAVKYSQVGEVISKPKPYCALAEEIEKCICLSQQGTRMMVDYDICSDIARNGLFDSALPDRGGAAGDGTWPTPDGQIYDRAVDSRFSLVEISK